MVLKIDQKRQYWRICYTQLHAIIKVSAHFRALNYHFYARSAVYYSHIDADIVILGHATFLAQFCREFLFWPYSYGLFTPFIAHFFLSIANHSQQHTHLCIRKAHALLDADHASAFLPIFGCTSQTLPGNSIYDCLYRSTHFAL